MALSGPIVVVADEQSRCAKRWRRRAISRCATRRRRGRGDDRGAKPSAVVLAFETPDPGHIAAQEIADAVDGCGGSIIPISRWYPTMSPAYPLALPVTAATVPARLVPRLRSALRVRALHATVLRRIEDAGRRRRRARHRRLRSDRGCDRTGRRARPQLSGAHRRDRRAHGPDRRAVASRPRAAISARAMSTAW